MAADVKKPEPTPVAIMLGALETVNAEGVSRGVRWRILKTGGHRKYECGIAPVNEDLYAWTWHERDTFQQALATVANLIAHRIDGKLDGKPAGKPVAKSKGKSGDS